MSRGVFVHGLNQKEPSIPSLYPDLDLCMQLLLVPVGPGLRVRVRPKGRIFYVDFKGSWIRAVYEQAVRKWK